jgi:uncharacterized protein YacL
MTEILTYINSAVLILVFLVLLKRSEGNAASSPSKKSSRRMIIDSCALIDGRIVELAKAGFTPDTLVVPAFIVRELQSLADGNDSMKRERARFGLDIIKDLQGLPGVEVQIDTTDFEDVSYTDDKLVRLAQKSGASLYTTDFNLLKVAEGEGVTVLNVNELTHLLRPTVLPGEFMTVKIVQKGSNRGQGVGYADDGTMIVVEQTDKMIGKTVSVEVDRMHNTLAGKMIFAKLKAGTVVVPSPKVASVKNTTEPKSNFSAPKPKTRSFKPRQQSAPDMNTAKPKIDDIYVSDLRSEIR